MANLAIVALILIGSIVPGSPLLVVFEPFSGFLPVVGLIIATLLIRPLATREWLAAIDVVLVPWSAGAILFLWLGLSARGNVGPLLAWAIGLLLFSVAAVIASLRLRLLTTGQTPESG